RTADYDIDALGLCCRHEPLQSQLVIQQRITPRKQRGVRLDVRKVQKELDGLDLVDAQTPSLDRTLVAQLAKRDERSLPRCLEQAEPTVTVKILRDVMDPNEVKMIAIHALDAVLDRLLRAIGRVVIDDLVRTTVLEDVALFAEVTGADILDLIENESTGFCT